VATAGDVNGDGYADLIVGDPGYNSYQGKAYVYHGTPWGLTPACDWTAGGEEADDQFGYAAGTAGDVNGDGYDDLAVGAWNYDGGRGRAYLFPGTPAGLSWVPAWVATGENAGDQFARSVATAGDVNGDGYDDLVAGAPGNDGNGTNAGKAYLFYGSAAGLDGAPGWSAAGANSGTALAHRRDGGRRERRRLRRPGRRRRRLSAWERLRQGLRLPRLGGRPGWQSPPGPRAASKPGTTLGTRPARRATSTGTAAPTWSPGPGVCRLQGKAYVYHGCSPDGLAATPAWTATGPHNGAEFGYSVATAGM